MKNKVLYLIVFVLFLSSCGIKNDEEKDINTNELSNTGVQVNNQIIQENSGSVDNNVNYNNNVSNTMINNSGSLVNIDENSKEYKKEEEKYLKLEKLNDDEIISYDCNNFKIHGFIEKCFQKIITINYIKNTNNDLNETNDKMKILNDGNLSYCEKYLKEKQEYGYFNCSLAIIIVNNNSKCNNIKNVNNFSKYFGKTCEQMLSNINKYIEIEVAKQNYEQMINFFWPVQERNENQNINEMYINNKVNKERQKIYKQTIVKPKK